MISTKCLSLHFNGHFPGGPGSAGTRMSPFWILLALRIMKVVATTGAIRRAKLQSNRHHQQTDIQFFYRPYALPFTQPTVSKHWRENIHKVPGWLKTQRCCLDYYQWCSRVHQVQVQVQVLTVRVQVLVSQVQVWILKMWPWVWLE